MEGKSALKFEESMAILDFFSVFDINSFFYYVLPMLSVFLKVL
jgi:hypothetical protein